MIKQYGLALVLLMALILSLTGAALFVLGGRDNPPQVDQRWQLEDGATCVRFKNISTPTCYR